MTRIRSTDAFGLDTSALETAGAEWTAAEVLQQPDIWREVEALMAREAGRIGIFLGPLLRRPDLRIVLTGAGTSSFIGECLAPAMTRVLDRRVEAISTTDLVASPDSWLQARAPTLLVSFARSGNSPESVSAVALASSLVTPCAHLIITCNADGALSRWAKGQPDTCVILLPAASNDRGFAMTSSFTGMVLAAALAFGLLTPGDGRVQAVSSAARALQARLRPTVQALVEAKFERVVYLGSKELKGLAKEAALKMLELTDGRVVVTAESPLGFRHGPKTVLNARTLVVVFLSGDAYARRYDLDLLAELRREAVAGRVLALSGTADGAPDSDTITLDASLPSDLELCLPYAVFAQTLALLSSLAVGMRPDQPNAAGTVSRVVQGVEIYPWRGRA